MCPHTPLPSLSEMLLVAPEEKLSDSPSSPMKSVPYVPQSGQEGRAFFLPHTHTMTFIASFPPPPPILHGAMLRALQDKDWAVLSVGKTAGTHLSLYQKAGNWGGREREMFISSHLDCIWPALFLLHPPSRVHVFITFTQAVNRNHLVHLLLMWSLSYYMLQAFLFFPPLL